MKKKLRLSIIVLLGIFLLLGGSIVQAQAAPNSVIEDEYGPGYYKALDPAANDSWHVWNGQLRNDPTWTGHQSLIYIGLRGGSWTGYYDLLVKDPTGAVSDILRFYNPTDDLLHSWDIFYSADTSGGAPADTGLPDSSTWNVFLTVYEGSDGIFYYTSTQTGNEYKGYSDGRAPVPSVPEPATMMLLGLGLIGLAGVRRKFKQ